MALTLDHHRMQVIAHGTPDEGMAVISAAPDHFIHGIGEMVHAVSQHGGGLGRFTAHARLVGNKRVSAKEKRELILKHAQTGSGFFDFLKDIGSTFVNAVPQVLDIATKAAPLIAMAL